MLNRNLSYLQQSFSLLKGFFLTFFWWNICSAQETWRQWSFEKSDSLRIQKKKSLLFACACDGVYYLLINKKEMTNMFYHPVKLHLCNVKNNATCSSFAVDSSLPIYASKWFEIRSLHLITNLMHMVVRNAYQRHFKQSPFLSILACLWSTVIVDVHKRTTWMAIPWRFCGLHLNFYPFTFQWVWTEWMLFLRWICMVFLKGISFNLSMFFVDL